MKCLLILKKITIYFSQEKTCFGFPENCDQKRNCEYMFAWKINGDKVKRKPDGLTEIRFDILMEIRQTWNLLVNGEKLDMGLID